MDHRARREHHLEQFRKRLSKLGAISDDTWQAFSDRMHYVQIPKNAIITNEGEIEDKVYFIVDGTIRVFVIRNGREIATNFRFKSEFASSITSFLTQTPSQYCIKTLTKSELLAISHDDLYWLYEHFIEINVLGRVMMEILLIDKRQRELDLLTLSADQRYYKLLAQHPEYVQHIPLKYLASFLGVTAESLSRIRAKKAQDI